MTRRTVWRRKRSRRPSPQRKRLRRRPSARRPRRSRPNRQGRDWRLECQTLRRTGRRGREPASTRLRPNAPPPIVDDGGRRRDRGSAFTRCSASSRPARSASCSRFAGVLLFGAHDRSRAPRQAGQASREARARRASRAASLTSPQLTSNEPNLEHLADALGVVAGGLQEFAQAGFSGLSQRRASHRCVGWVSLRNPSYQPRVTPSSSTRA